MKLAPIAALSLLATQTAHAADLALRRVMLSSAGVGYFEYQADIDGPATLGLDIPLSEVDDVLKSLVVFDDAGGVGGIELPGRDQAHSAFGDVPFGPEGLASPLAYLNSLQGVEITVQGPRPMTGRLMQAETVQENTDRTTPDGAPTTQSRTRVSVLTDDGLKQFVLEDTDSVQVADPALRARIDLALTALKRESGQDARHITIRTAGRGHRTVRVGYVAVAPLWKASYRLVLPPQNADPAHATARLQGWATLENDSGTDWSGVSLTLQYGNPVTFHQAIYRSYFVDRPEVPVEVLGRLLPDVDTRAVPPPELSASPPSPPAPAPVEQFRAVGSESSPLVVAARQQMARPSETVVATEGAEETVFPLATPIALAAGHSASVAILDRDLPASRVDIAQQNESHPRSAIRLRNDTPQSLPAGILTLYDAQGDAPYAGDARLGGLPSGEDRLISFAQDLRTTLEWHTDVNAVLASIKADGGFVEIDHRERTITQIKLTAPQHEPRRVLLELNKSNDVTMAEGFPKPTEETANAWRFAIDLKPAETRTVRLGEDSLQTQSVGIGEAVTAFVRILNEQGLSPATRAALQHIGDLANTEAARTDKRDQLTTQRQTLDSDEARLRENLRATQQGDALHTKLIRQLDSDETTYGALATSIEKANQLVAAASKALSDAIGALNL